LLKHWPYIFFHIFEHKLTAPQDAHKRLVLGVAGLPWLKHF